MVVQDVELVCVEILVNVCWVLPTHISAASEQFKAYTGEKQEVTDMIL